MNYRSTRGNVKDALKSSDAVVQGLAPDGGLYVPVDFPKPAYDLEKLIQLPYQQLAKTILQWFFDDYPEDQLADGTTKAYASQWDDDSIAPLSREKAGFNYLELYHGPTLAFKDIALQMLPQLMTKAVKLNGVNRDIVILTATSGDTGTASMRGFSNVDGTQVIVFYPDGGVSPVQLKQMLSQPGQNLTAVAVKGNFDDAQTEVKHIFNDHAFNQRLIDNGYQFSSANSMNIGRLIPQVVYYFAAYGQLVEQGQIKLGDAINFTVPTGNFGDILAGWYAKKLGLPVNKLICASNENKVLTDFFTTGKYDRRRDFHLTSAPAMDILVSSNLERLLFDVYDEDAASVKELMEQLQNDGWYQITAAAKAKLDSEFAAGYATQSQVAGEIKYVYETSGYLIDPHTAVGSYVARNYQKEIGDQTPMVIVSTASPYKFPETVYHALTGRDTDQQGMPAIKQLHDLVGGELTAGVKELFDHQPRKESLAAPDEMEKIIAEVLELK